MRDVTDKAIKLQDGDPRKLLSNQVLDATLSLSVE